MLEHDRQLFRHHIEARHIDRVRCFLTHILAQLEDPVVLPIDPRLDQALFSITLDGTGPYTPHVYNYIEITNQNIYIYIYIYIYVYIYICIY